MVIIMCLPNPRRIYGACFNVSKVRDLKRLSSYATFLGPYLGLRSITFVHRNASITVLYQLEWNAEPVMNYIQWCL